MFDILLKNLFVIVSYEVFNMFYILEFCDSFKKDIVKKIKIIVILGKM